MDGYGSPAHFGTGTRLSLRSIQKFLCWCKSNAVQFKTMLGMMTFVIGRAHNLLQMSTLESRGCTIPQLITVILLLLKFTTRCD